MHLKSLPLIIALLAVLISPQITFSRTTPEDIVNAKRDTYNQRVSNYSPENKQKLENYSKKIAELNKKITDDYDLLMMGQSQILEEYLKRNPDKASSKEVENARYWLTYAHEAVAFQAAKIYIFDLTGQSAINSNILSQINILQGEINTLKGKVQKSQNIIKELVK